MIRPTRRIYLPGAGGSADFWRPVASLLDDGADQKLLAWPGLGDEPSAPDVAGFDDLARLVEKELDEPADIIAQSMGGLIAVRIALRHPDKVRRLVLTAASVGLHARALGGSDWLPAYRSAYPHAAHWVADPAPDVTDELLLIASPVLVICGDCDPISPVAVGQRLKDLLPDARLCIVRGGDHDLAQTHAPEVADLIRQSL